MRTRQLLYGLALAAVYFFVARLSLLLAFQNSNATPVWPPSGIALAAVLLLGYRVIPAVALGSFSVNLYAFAVHHACSLPTAFMVSLVIAAGNSAEACAGAYLIK